MVLGLITNRVDGWRLQVDAFRLWRLLSQLFAVLEDHHDGLGNTVYQLPKPKEMILLQNQSRATYELAHLTRNVYAMVHRVLQRML
jgi:hypothetical protein